MHGLSGTGEVWAGLREILKAQWPGRWLIPDMRGHGRSSHAHHYGIANHAADMADLLRNVDRPCLVGHSMGGLVGILLASKWFGVVPETVIALGVKISWSDEEFATVDRLAKAPTRWFGTEQEARERFVLVTGLRGIVDPDSEIAASGVVHGEGRWRLAADNRTAEVAHADMREIFRLAQRSVTLAAGEHDSMVAAEQMQALDPEAVILPGLGHNAHVEDPAAIWELIREKTGA